MATSHRDTLTITGTHARRGVIPRINNILHSYRILLRHEFRSLDIHRCLGIAYNEAGPLSGQNLDCHTLRAV